jgi:hypothetical protein
MARRPSLARRWWNGVSTSDRLNPISKSIKTTSHGFADRISARRLRRRAKCDEARRTGNADHGLPGVGVTRYNIQPTLSLGGLARCLRVDGRKESPLQNLGNLGIRGRGFFECESERIPVSLG